MAQSGMAKGPDGTAGGFETGWTKRISLYQDQELVEEDKQDSSSVDLPEASAGINIEAEVFVPKGIGGNEES